MSHIPIWLGGALFFSVIVVIAAVAYACLQLLAWIFGALIELGAGIGTLIYYRQWQAIDADDWIGVAGVVFALATMIAFVVGIQS
jgi:hypothetical protein